MKIVSILIVALIISSFFLSIGYISAEDSKLSLKVGVYDNEPLVFMDKNGNVKGLYPDLLRYISTMENWDIEYVPGSFEECLNRLNNKEIDILAGIAYSDERNKIYDFSKETVFTNWGQVYTQKNKEINSLFDLKDKKIAVLKGDIYYSGPNGIKTLMDKFDISCVFIEVNEYYEVFKYIEDGKADVGVVNRLFGTKNQDNYRINETSIVFSPIELRFGFPKENPKNIYLIEKIDYYIYSMKMNPDSFYYSTMDRYIETQASNKVIEIIPIWAKYLIVLALIFLGLVLLFVHILRRELKRKTEKLSQTIKRLEEEIESRKKLESNLIDSEKRYRNLIEDSSDAIWTSREDGTIVDSNEAASKLLGYALNEFIGLSAKRLYVNPEDRESFRKIVEMNDSVKDYEVKLKKKDGEIIDCLFTSSIWKDSNGNILGYRGIVRDITERKKLEQELLLSKFRLTNIIEHNKDAMLVIDEKGYVIFKNTSAEQMFDILEGELTGNYFGFPYLIKDSEEIEIIKKDGNLLISEIRKTEIDWEGKTVYLLSIRDITERKKTMKQIEQNIEYFAHIVDHIRNPLAILSGFVQIKIDDEEIKTRVLRQVDRIEKIIKQLDQGWMDTEDTRRFLKGYKE